MTAADALAAWIAADPDPVTRAELAALPAEEVAERFRGPLTFGTAGLRGPVRAGPNGMNVAVVVRATAGLAAWLTERGQGGGTVVVGRDARHGSAEFARAAAEVLAAAGFRVVFLPRPLPTPVVAFAVRRLGAVGGVQITASHNPAQDNGYKVYLSGGAQLVSPADREIEARIAAAAPAADIPRTPVTPSGDELVEAYLDRVGGLPTGERRDIRIALTALHGVGGATATAALARAGFNDVHTVTAQHDPDPDFPSVSFPNPEEPGATDALLDLARSVGADLAIALDPDADRCALGVPTPDGWRMLRGDETGVLLGNQILASSPPGALVATTIVSSTLLNELAAARGARSARTLTGFKWLTRAGDGLVYAYEEAIGHCVDPDHVRDKDGISAAVVAADLVARLAADGRTLLDVLDDLAVEFGLHAGDQVSLRVTLPADLTALTDRLRADLPTELAGEPVTVDDLLDLPEPRRTDALVFEGRSIRVVVRPSGTEPKLKCYLEVVEPVAGRDDLGPARSRARERLDHLRAFAETL
ncbi:phospho-sugar mutase [Rhodococcus triatomae]|uniref:Phosphomannomutase n=1 Tax=Rhodococcus triatomae TaxID=300028 RepID=A0A1G8FHX8_9NOCA|nr:phospho-sugar mutase [Rhodococcus triatomae]QNG19488.1 phospho-sugar mutase [Rhodococcus triatomae]QNG24597.1 phospho-sugar mutase [Rhodococcus triatomae]SDH81725.1 phosphomannomutase [Rhodococcus triatomae]